MEGKTPSPEFIEAFNVGSEITARHMQCGEYADIQHRFLQMTHNNNKQVLDHLLRCDKATAEEMSYLSGVIDEMEIWLKSRLT